MRRVFLNRNDRYLLIAVAAWITVASASDARAQAARYTVIDSSQTRSINQLPMDNSHADAAGTGGQRPIEDFLKAQGTTSSFYRTAYAPDLTDYAVGFSSAPCPGQFCQYPTSRIAVVDYAGGADKYLQKNGRGPLNTKTDGSITERVLPDGRAEVTIVLHTENALTFASTWDYSLPMPPQSAETNTRLFGSSVSDLLRDPSRRPSLASSDLVMIYRSPKPGAPMPDLVQMFAFGAYPTLELISLYFSVNADGTLPNGTPAKCNVLQHGVFPPPMLINGVPSGPIFLLDGGFISEFVDIK
jgi:hypothetical protein